MSFRTPSANTIPPEEFRYFAELVRSHPEYLKTAHIKQVYTSLGLQVLPDPFGSGVSDLTVQALQTGTPLSVIRIGDGEMNILAYGAYPDIPKLSDANFRSLVENQEDSFKLDEFWKFLLRDMLMSSVAQADVVGLVGLWLPPAAEREQESIEPERFIEGMMRQTRGFCGYWQSLDHFPRLVRSSLFKGKIIASWHLYLGVLQSLDRIVPNAERILLLTNHGGVVERMRKKYPRSSVGYIRVGRVKANGGPLPKRPAFLQEVADELPMDMRGCLCLVGAGFWAEIYCTWIKQRGGVAIDIGSGFDLLNGAVRRPIHRALGYDQHNPFTLGEPSGVGGT